MLDVNGTAIAGARVSIQRKHVFDPDHPETNGMIDYFLRPLAGMRTELTFQELIDYRSQPGMGFRAKPPAVCAGHVSHGTLDLVAPCARARRLAGRAGAGTRRCMRNEYLDVDYFASIGSPS